MLLTYSVGTDSASNLWQLIQDYTVNYEQDFINDIPTFVQITEEKIYNEVQLPANQISSTGSLSAGNQYLSLPAGTGTFGGYSPYIYAYSIAVIDPTTGAYTFLINKDVEYIRECYPIPTYTATPTYYAQFNYETLIVGPTPDVSYAVELRYNIYPTSIVNEGSSWLGNTFGELLLYGSLREAYIYMKGEPDVIQMYEGKYNEGLALLKKLGSGKLRRDAYRDGQVRLPVNS